MNKKTMLAVICLIMALICGVSGVILLTTAKKRMKEKQTTTASAAYVQTIEMI